MTRPSMSLLSVFSLIFVVGCGTTPGPNIPPQAPAALSGPAVDTSVLAPEEKEPVTFQILHTNDIHGQIQPQKAVWVDRDNPPLAGGADALAGYIWKVREEHGKEKVVLVDSGDIYAGTPEGNLTKGQYVIDLMNALGYDAMAVGNHEFDMGLDVYNALADNAKFPFLAANIYAKSTPEGEKVGDRVKPGVIIERGGVKIGIVGVIAKETPLYTPAATAKAYEFMEPLQGIEDTVGTLKADGADFVIVLSHVGVENEKAMLEKMPEGVVALLGGHSHTGISPMFKADNGVVYMQTHGKTSEINHLTVRITEDGVEVVDGNLVALATKDYPKSDAVAEVSKKYKADIDKIMNEVVGKCDNGLSRKRGFGSSPMGSFVADTMKAKTKADIAIGNKGGLRKDMVKGDVQMRDLFEVLPFGNSIYTLSLTGKQLQVLIENAYKKSLTALEVSGLTYDVKVADGAGTVSNIKVNGKKLDLKKNYKVATSSFLAHGGDGHAIFKKAKKPEDSGVLIRDALAEHFRAKKGCQVKNVTRVKLTK